jgi:threonine dehydratase
MNFSRLRFVAERSLLGAGAEILFTVLIPERPGTFQQLINSVVPRAITEFSYRYNDPDVAAIYISFAVSDREREKAEVTQAWDEMGFEWEDISGDELAKSHGRYLVGGIGGGTEERLYRFEFPERPGALHKFLSELRPGWNISLFHYRNHGHGILLFVLTIDSRCGKDISWNSGSFCRAAHLGRISRGVGIHMVG